MFLKLPDWVRYEIRHGWERFIVDGRRWVNRRPRLIGVVAGVSVLMLLAVIVVLLIPEEKVEVKEYKKAWFYDLNTGELFVASNELAGPIEAPSGPLACGRPAGVRAYVFSYSDEPNEAERFVGFLERPWDGAKEEDLGSAKAGGGGVSRWGHGRLICRAGDERWVPADCEEGRAILRWVFVPNKAGQIAHYCAPE
jgi:hypothetical protein